MPTNYNDLLPYATETQEKYILALNEYGSQRNVAKALGVNARSVTTALRNLKLVAAMRGYSPEHNMVHDVPNGYHVKGVSTYYNADGQPTAQWVKSNIDREKYAELMQEIVRSFLEDVPKIQVPKPLKKYNEDIIPWFEIGDAHLGMLAHAAETGISFDLKIAERELCTAFSIMFDECTPCDRCVINDLGDFTHYENYQGETEAGKHQQDFDSRFPKMIHTYARIMRFIVEKALTRFKHVDVIINQGNHSRTNDVWMAVLLKNVYEHTGRVHVLDNGQAFIPYRMGNTFVMTHHSDKCKPDRLAYVMANDFAQDWGETEFHYIDIGHYHQKMVREVGGVIIEMWNTLAPRDKYANDGGWRSRQSITRVDRSKTYGEIGRRVLGIREIWDQILKTQPDVELPSKRRLVHTV